MALRRVVLIGSPGGGKTTVLAALQRRGHVAGTDTARSIIQGRKREGLSPRPEPRAFAEAIFRLEAQQHAGLTSPTGLVFFERGVVDALGMLHALGELPDHRLLALLAAYPYHRQVFLFSAWAAIYVTDDERDQSLAEAAAVAEAADAWYRRCGYEVVEVPNASVADRCDFILQALHPC